MSTATTAIPTEMIARLTQSGLGLPDRDYYLRDDASSGREAQRLSGLSRPAADPGRRGERRGARRRRGRLRAAARRGALDPGRESRRRARPTTNGRSPISPATRPGFDWAAISEATGLAGQPTSSSRSRAPSPAPPRIVGETPLPVLKDYLLLRVDRQCRALPVAGRSSTPISPSTAPCSTARRRTRSAGSAASTSSPRAIPDDVSQIYVERYFPPETKARPTSWSATSSRRWTGASQSLDLDGARDQGAGAGQARRLHPEDRLSRPLARLFERRGSAATDLLAQRHARDRVRISAQPRQARPAGRPQRMGHDADDGERLRQSGVERDRLPGRDPAAALLRSQCRSGGQLWRHRRGDRPRDQPPFRRSGQPATTRPGRFGEWWTPEDVEPLQCADRAARRPI